MRNLLLALIVSGISLSIYGQKLGYIKNDSASVSCDIYKQSEAKSANSCIVRLANNSLYTYTPEQILAYGYGKTDYYSLKIKSGSDTVRKFLLAIVQGELPVYYLNDINGKHFYILNSNKSLIELIKEDGEYKHQLAAYYNASTDTIPYLHNRFNVYGMKRTIKSLQAEGLKANTTAYEKNNVNSNGSKNMAQSEIADKPILSLTFQSGFTAQKLPLQIDIDAGVPESWDSFKSKSITYSLAADIPVLKYWPVSYHQEVSYSKFVNDYKKGTEPPDIQLIQNFSVLSLPMMFRYTLEKKKLGYFVNAGVQIDVALNKNNVEWLILNANDFSSTSNGVITGSMDYATFQPGITAGFGINYKADKNLYLSTEFRYSRIHNVLPSASGIESLYIFRLGITYNIFNRIQ
jgi:hypothetical protein